MLHFDDRPLLAIWEMTQACDLACKHCRASAKENRDTAELTTAQGKALLKSLADEQVRLVVLTGGDPAKRPDLLELVEYGSSLGLTVGLTPSATPLMTRELIFGLAKAGLSRLAVSIDGATPEVHDAFRGVPGAFDAAQEILRAGKEAGLALQINTSVHAGNVDSVLTMEPVVQSLGIKLWSLFVVVATGRAKADMTLGPERVERFLEELADVHARVPFAIKTTAAPMYRRILIQRKRSASHGTYGLDSLRVNEGRGSLFVSHKGEVMPSGFLPIPCGNIKDGTSPVTIYRESPVFQRLRDEESFTGKCSVCEYRKVCGGSRARSYSKTNDPFSSDPACAYIPPGYTKSPEPVHLPLL
jgi:AdoMet-dependent heme synthase